MPLPFFLQPPPMHDAYAYCAARTTNGSVPVSAITGAACSDDGSP